MWFYITQCHTKFKLIIVIGGAMNPYNNSNALKCVLFECVFLERALCMSEHVYSKRIIKAKSEGRVNRKGRRYTKYT